MMINFILMVSLIYNLYSYPFAPLAVGIEEIPIEVKEIREIREVRKVWVTAYSSTPDQTDDTPFITASGKLVRDGIIACNFLEFGTEVQIPDLFGDEIFVVEDRMHRRKTNFVDVWMPTKQDALNLGITHTEIIVLN